MKIKSELILQNIADDNLLLVGGRIKSKWVDGKPTEEKEIIAILYALNEGISYDEIRVKMPYTIGNHDVIAKYKGQIIGNIKSAFDGIVDEKTTIYEGQIKSSYVICHAAEINPVITVMD